MNEAAATPIVAQPAITVKIPASIREGFDPLQDVPKTMTERALVASLVPRLNAPVKDLNRKKRRAAQKRLIKNMGGRAKYSEIERSAAQFRKSMAAATVPQINQDRAE